MKIAHLTSVHPRYDTRIFLKQCRCVAAGGHDVTLVVADGQGDEERAGVHVIDVGKPVGRADRMLKTVNEIYRVAKALGAGIYHLHDPELLRIAGRLSRIGGGTRVVFDAHEDVPRQILSKQWIPAPLRRPTSWVAERCENHIARQLDGIVTATPHIAECFRRINDNTISVNNFPMPDELAAIGDGSASRKHKICYVGGITKVRGIEPLIRALPLLPSLKLVLCGRFQESEFEKSARALRGWARVDYRGQADRLELRKVMGECCAGIVTFLPEPNHKEAQPNKMFEYMSAALPVIASDFPLWRKIIDGSECGLCVNPHSPEAIAKAIRFLMDNPEKAKAMGQNGRKAVLECYNWPHEVTKLIDFYRELV